MEDNVRTTLDARHQPRGGRREDRQAPKRRRTGRQDCGEWDEHTYSCARVIIPSTPLSPTVQPPGATRPHSCFFVDALGSFLRREQVKSLLLSRLCVFRDVTRLCIFVPASNRPSLRDVYSRRTVHLCVCARMLTKARLISPPPRFLLLSK